MQKYKPQLAFLSDINQDLIITYEVIRDDMEFFIQHLHIHKTNHRKNFEKLGNQKKIKIQALNKKAQKIKMYLRPAPTRPSPTRTPNGTCKAQIELHKILEELKEIKKEKRIDKDYIPREIYNKTLSKVEIAS